MQLTHKSETRIAVPQVDISHVSHTFPFMCRDMMGGAQKFSEVHNIGTSQLSNLYPSQRQA